MNRRLLKLPLALALACGFVAHADEPLFEPDRVFVRLQPGASIASLNATYGTTLRAGDSIPSRNMYLLDLPEGASESTFVDLLAADPRVLRSDFNFYTIDGNPNGTTRRMYLSVPPADYDSDATPGVVGVPAAWTQSTGAGAIVAVLDTGVDSSHPLLAGRVLSGFNFLTNATGTLETLQNVDTSLNGEFDELYGHGTLVAGLVTRLAPDSRVLPVTVMDSDGMATIFRLSQGLFYALDRGAHVANVSMGMETDPQLLREVISEVEAAGLIVVASAGNRANNNPDYPAGASNVGLLAITATNDADQRAAFSNYGTWVSLSAPGVDIVSPVPGGGYGIASGTSLSAPLVAGGAALVRSICPLVSSEQIDAILRTRSTPIDSINPGFEGQLGTGRLNVAAAVGVGAPPLTCDCDRNNDRRVTLHDAYLLALQPVDANGDGVANTQDATDLKNWLRRGEPRQLLTRP